MLTVVHMGEGGVKNHQKSVHVINGRPLAGNHTCLIKSENVQSDFDMTFIAKKHQKENSF